MPKQLSPTVDFAVAPTVSGQGVGLSFVYDGVKTSLAGYTLASWHAVDVDCTSAPQSIPLPASPKVNDEVWIANVASAGGNSLTVTTGSGLGGPFTVLAAHGQKFYWNGTLYERREGHKGDSALDYRYQSSVVVRPTGTVDDTPAIQAAFNSLKVNGHATGTLKIVGPKAKLSTQLVLDGGYSNVSDGSTQWAAGAGEVFRLEMDGSFCPDAGNTQAVVLKGFYNPTAEVRFKGGGQRRAVTNVSSTAGSNVLSFVSGITSADVGKVCWLGVSGYTIATAINSGTATTSITLSSAVQLLAGTRLVLTDSNSNTYTVTVGTMSSASTTVPVGSFTPTANIASGSAVAVPNFGPGYNGALWGTISAVSGSTVTITGTAANTLTGSLTILDAGLHVENIIGGSIYVDANSYAGTVIHLDQTNAGPGINVVTGTQNNVTQTTFKRARALSCGQMLYMRYLNGGFGGFEDVWDDNSANGSYVGFCSDTNFDHIEDYHPSYANNCWWFESCNNIHIGYFDGGDTVGEADIKVSANSSATSSGMRFSHVRIGGSPPPGAEGSDPICMRIVDVDSINIDQLTTLKSLVGLQIEGANVDVKLHHSQTADSVPLKIYGTPYNPSPQIHVRPRYHYNYRQPVVLDASLSGSGTIRLDGIIDNTCNQSGISYYCIDSSASATTQLDLRGLLQITGPTYTGFTNHAGPILGLNQAALANASGGQGGIWVEGATRGQFSRLAPTQDGTTLTTDAGNTTKWGTGVVANLLTELVVSNSNTETVLLAKTLSANVIKAGTTYRISAYGNTDNIASSGTLIFRVRYGGVNGVGLGTITLPTQSAAATVKTWHLDADIIFRSTTQMAGGINGNFGFVVSGGSIVNYALQTGATIDTTTAKDLVISVLWATADPGNILRCESAVIQALKL